MAHSNLEMPVGLQDFPLEVLAIILDTAAERSPQSARALRRTCRAFAAAPYTARHFRRPAGLISIPEYLHQIHIAALAIVTSVRVHDHFDPYRSDDLLLKVPSSINGRRAQPEALVRYAEAAEAAFAHLTSNVNEYMREVIAAMFEASGDDEVLWDEAELLSPDCQYQTRAVYMLLYRQNR